MDYDNWKLSTPPEEEEKRDFLDEADEEYERIRDEL